ncbi:MAG: RnfABCDGE type electron transport complex subunit G [Proteobacteria bacterium]|nr:RnfABCDGE type electron transport complex subunit G [Pseudomonadota bacterium]
MRNKIWYMAVVLGLVGSLAGLALASIKKVTDPIIEKRILNEKVKPTLDKFLEPAGADNDYIADKITLDLGVDQFGRKQKLNVFKGKKGGQVVAAAMQTAAPGYGGNIDVLTVFDLETKKIFGVKTLSQSETKGLGARVSDDSEPFIQQFSGMNYARGVKLKADGGQVDVISGATISSVAFTKAVNAAASVLDKHNAEIVKP